MGAGKVLVGRVLRRALAPALDDIRRGIMKDVGRHIPAALAILDAIPTDTLVDVLSDRINDSWRRRRVAQDGDRAALAAMLRAFVAGRELPPWLRYAYRQHTSKT